MKIAVFGAGYVGLANALLLDTKNEVTVFDISKDKIQLLQNRISPIEDELIEQYLKTCNVQFLDHFVDQNFDAVIIATPTNYDPELHQFDTSSIEQTIVQLLPHYQKVPMIIKSTIPIGYTESIREKYQVNAVFCPEFLREGQALKDNLYPSRIIVGNTGQLGKEVAQLFTECILNEAPVLLMNAKEAESVKLFANTYLAMRVAFFNELDNFAIHHQLDARSIIEGIGLDTRIGNYYNNPSFGYGGYCLPKDTKELAGHFADIPEALITAIVQSNEKRKAYITQEILKHNPKSVGIHRLSMKMQSDNFRSSSIIDVISELYKAGVHICIYEPMLEEQTKGNLEVTHSLDKVKAQDLIIMNRYDHTFDDVKEKVWTRDIFHMD